MKKKIPFFEYVKKSKFVRSVFIRVSSIFLITSVIIMMVVFYSFAKEIRNDIVLNRQNELLVAENTISDRMGELTDIVYSISEDNSFYTEPVLGDGAEMTEALKRYLSGNNFIEYIAYYRLSETDKIYTSNGEITFSSFWSSYLDVDESTANVYIQDIQNAKNIDIRSLPNNDEYVTYICPLPLYAIEPKAFIIAMISMKDISVLASDTISDEKSLFIYNANGEMIYKQASISQESISYDELKNGGVDYVRIEGKKYAIQKQVSSENGWIYVSAIPISNVLFDLANSQIFLMIFVLVFVFIAVVVIFIVIVEQYKPISKLAESVANSESDEKSIIDESTLLVDKFATLKDDSEQKQKFESAYNEANLANKAKSAFLSNMSHDIRTPMNAIVGMTEIAYKHANEPEYVKECLEKVQTASQYLLDIINNVLDMSKIESGKFTLSKEIIELPKIVHSIITMLNPTIESNGLHLVVEISNILNEEVLGDNVRLSQAFMNILSNSVKYTPRGGKISVQIEELPSTKDNFANFMFVFKDTGVGMSPEFISKVFDTFSRADDPFISKIEGTGLGMAITKNLIGLMGGTIECESIIEKGTTFTINLQMELPKKVTTNNYEKFSNISVLIVEESEEVSFYQKKLFEKFAVNVDRVISKEDMTILLSNNKIYDFIIYNYSGNYDNDIVILKRLMSKYNVQKTTYVLAAKDLVNLKYDELKNLGIASLVQKPMFPSMISKILHRSFDKENINTPTKKVVDLCGMKILLVEDNPLNLEIATKIISETKAEITKAENGKEAVDAYMDSPERYFDIILMDLQMPIMNGYEATKYIRHSKRSDAKKIPIYAMTANAFDEDVRQVKDAGMNGHISKPYSAKELYSVLESIFRRDE